MQDNSATMIDAVGLTKRFTLHNQGGIDIPVLGSIDLSVEQGECVVLHGPSGTGKSTLMRILYGNYLANGGALNIRHQGEMIDLVKAEPQEILSIRKETMGYVSQFLRVIPRVSARDIVAEPLIALGEDEGKAVKKAEEMLARLNLPEGLWSLAPATFSGGEQQRVNIARGFIVDYPILLLDEPTASLDENNRQVVTDLIRGACARGAAIVGIFHDDAVRQTVGTRLFDLSLAEKVA